MPRQPNLGNFERPDYCLSEESTSAVPSAKSLALQSDNCLNGVPIWTFFSQCFGLSCAPSVCILFSALCRKRKQRCLHTSMLFGAFLFANSSGSSVIVAHWNTACPAAIFWKGLVINLGGLVVKGQRLFNFSYGAQKRTWTSTASRPLAPEASVSTNFTTWA